MSDRDERIRESANGGSGGCLQLEPLLAEYVDGTLAAPDRQVVERHLASCAACSELVSDAAAGAAVCRRTMELAPPPRLVARILEQTSGKLPWQQRLRGWFRPVLEPRLALGTAMAVLSLSIAFNALGVDVSQMSVADLAPRRIYYRVDQRLHQVGSGAVKYYQNLRIVYEIQTQLQAIRDTSAEEQERREQQAPQKKQEQQTAPSRQGQPYPAAPQPPAHNRLSRHSPLYAFVIF